jgi:hypothetical protein
MDISVNRITNANIYMDGTGLLGRAEEIQVAQPHHRMVDHKALGMAGTAEFFGRGLRSSRQKSSGLHFIQKCCQPPGAPLFRTPFRCEGAWINTRARGVPRSYPLCT